MIPCDASWAHTWSMAAFPGMARATTMAQPWCSMSLLHATPRSLKPGHRVVDDLEALPEARALLQLVDGLGPHVVAGEHGVDDADAVHVTFSHGGGPRSARALHAVVAAPGHVAPSGVTLTAMRRPQLAQNRGGSSSRPAPGALAGGSTARAAQNAPAPPGPAVDRGPRLTCLARPAVRPRRPGSAPGWPEPEAVPCPSTSPMACGAWCRVVGGDLAEGVTGEHQAAHHRPHGARHAHPLLDGDGRGRAARHGSAPRGRCARRGAPGDAGSRRRPGCARGGRTPCGCPSSAR